MYTVRKKIRGRVKLMSRGEQSSEAIISKLREAEVLQAKGMSILEACRQWVYQQRAISL
jgi:hypothetical protein